MTLSLTWARPVRMMMPQEEPARTRCITSMPSMSGRPRSMMQRSGARLRRRRRRSPALRHQTVRKPKSPSTCSMILATSGSSSTMAISLAGSISLILKDYSCPLPLGSQQGTSQILADEGLGEHRQVAGTTGVAVVGVVGVAAHQHDAHVGAAGQHGFGQLAAVDAAGHDDVADDDGDVDDLVDHVECLV